MLDFSHTRLNDGQQTRENHAMLCFIKLTPAYRYGVFKTQNFEETGKSFLIAGANTELRTVDSDAGAKTGEVRDMIGELCQHFHCREDELDGKLQNHTFGIKINGEIFIALGAANQPANAQAALCLQTSPLVKPLHLLKAVDFASKTANDYRTFSQNKPAPVGGILSDCILRRLNNAPSSLAPRCMAMCRVAGFSTLASSWGEYHPDPDGGVFYPARVSAMVCRSVPPCITPITKLLFPPRAVAQHGDQRHEKPDHPGLQGYKTLATELGAKPARPSVAMRRRRLSNWKASKPGLRDFSTHVSDGARSTESVRQQIGELAEHAEQIGNVLGMIKNRRAEICWP